MIGDDTRLGPDDALPLPEGEPAAGGPARGAGGSLHRRLALNSASNVSRFVVFLGGAFLLTPFVVRTLGDAAYGFWVVLLSFVGYAGILELGVQPAVIKLVGQHRGHPDPRKLEELISAALLFFFAVGLLAALLVAFALPPLMPHLVKDHQGFGELRLLFAVVAADVLILFLNYVFAGVLYGWQLYHGKNLIDIAAWIMNALLLVTFLKHGGLLLLAVSKAGTDLLALLATIALCRRTLPEVRLTHGRVGRRSMEELIRFGSKLFASATSKRISNYAQPLIISSQISAAATAFFSIPVRLVDYAQQIAWALSTGFMPMFSELDGRNEREALRSIYMRYSRYILLLTLPILVLIFIYGPGFIARWIGPEYGVRGRDALYLLTAAALLEGLQPLIWRLFTGVGRLNLLVAVSAAASLMSVALGLLWVGRLGIAGVALGVLLMTAASQVVFFWHTSRYLSLSLLAQLREIQGRPLLVGGIYFALTYGIARFLGTGTYPIMTLGTVLSLIGYAPLAYISLRASERRTLLDLARRGLRARRRLP
jgi:O-antigen/teichoic acid export membrane protein